MKNPLNNKLVVGYIGSRSALAQAFKNQFKKKISFRIYYGDITKQKDIKNWLIKNSVDGIVGYLEQPQLDTWKEQLQDFVKMTETWDRQRNTNFSIVDDKLYEDIRKLVE